MPREVDDPVSDSYQVNMSASHDGVKKPQGWETILEYGKADDRKTLKEWQDELANLLVFIGLLAGVLTGFVVFSLPMLQEDPNERSAALLSQISLQLASFSLSPQFMNSTYQPTPPVSYRISENIRAINIVWISSLLLNVMAAFFTISAQQWLRRIPLPEHLGVRDAVRLRQLRSGGLLEWKVPTIISLIPVVVQLSAVFLLCGLWLVLQGLDETTARVFLILASITLGVWLIMTLLPLVFIDCAYKSPAIPVATTVLWLCLILAQTVVFVSIVAWPLVVCAYFLNSSSHPAHSAVLASVVIVIAFYCFLLCTVMTAPNNVLHLPPAVLRTVGAVRGFLLIQFHRTWLDIRQRTASWCRSLSYLSASFWTEREIAHASSAAAMLDRDALAYAALTVSEDTLWDIHAECLDGIELYLRADAALRCGTIYMAAHHQPTIGTLAPNVATLSPAIHGAALSTRTAGAHPMIKTLWRYLVVALDCVDSHQDFSSRIDTDGHDVHRARNERIVAALAFVYRSVVPVTGVPDMHETQSQPPSVHELARLLHDLLTSSPGEGIIRRPSGRLAATMLFGCFLHGASVPRSEALKFVPRAVEMAADRERTGWVSHIFSALELSLSEVPREEAVLCAVAVALRAWRAQPSATVNDATYAGSAESDEAGAPVDEIQQMGCTNGEAEHAHCPTGVGSAVDDPGHAGAADDDEAEQNDHKTLAGLLISLSQFLEVRLEELVAWVQQLSYLRRGRHIFLTYEAISDITESLNALLVQSETADVFVERTAEARCIAGALRTVCDATRKGKLRDAKERLCRFQMALDDAVAQHVPVRTSLARGIGDSDDEDDYCSATSH